MAHYDCSNCGDSYGIGYGKCDSCTPPEVFAAELRLAQAYGDAEQEWNKKVYELRKEFIAGKVAAAKAEYEAIYESGKKKC